MIRTPCLCGATDLRCHKPTSLGSDTRGKVESIRCFRCSYEPPSYVVVNHQPREGAFRPPPQLVYWIGYNGTHSFPLYDQM